MPIDPSAAVAPTARVDPEASVGPGVRIGEYCVVERGVAIGACTVLEPYVYLKRWTTLGERNEISAGTVLGTDPFDKKFTGKRSYLNIGNGNRIREHYTISRGTDPESETRIGDDNYIMSSGHIAHNCRVGNRNVIASCALLAGFVEVEDDAFISGGVAIHQFAKVGRLAMVAGNTGVSTDLPPFFLYAGFRAEAKGLNVVGLRRAGYKSSDLAVLKNAYQILYRAGLRLEEALRRIETEIPTRETLQMVEFIRRSKRGICRE
jgi:UDP-N-acetylglucosamine acyltransferase